MSLRSQSTVFNIFLLLVFAAIFSVAMHSSGAFADEPSADEMIRALSKKSAEEPAAGTAPMRGIGDNKRAAPPGRLQLFVNFDLGSAIISATSRGLLPKLGTATNSPALAGRYFCIEGHTDSAGYAEIIQQLSKRSVQSVLLFLKKNGGVLPNRFSKVGRSINEPIDASNPKTEVNKRVVVSVAENAGAPPANVAAIATVPNANATAGTIKQVRGEASVTRANISTRIIEGDIVKDGDTISTTAGASVIFQLSDDAKILVRPGSTVRLTQFKDSGPVEQRNQVIELTLGALRYVTGALGKLRSQGIHFKTPNATIGIRGTDIDIVHIAATRGLGGAGTYVRVNTGEVVLNGNDGSQVTLLNNEQAVAAQQGPRLRGGGRAPLAKKLDAPVSVFTSGELDSLLDGR